MIMITKPFETCAYTEACDVNVSVYVSDYPFKYHRRVLYLGIFTCLGRDHTYLYIFVTDIFMHILCIYPMRIFIFMCLEFYF